MSAKVRDLLGSILMLIFVAALWVQRDYTTPFGGIFPDLIMIGLVVLVGVTILLMFTPWRAIGNVEAERKAAGSRQWGDLAMVGVILLAWTALLRHLGFAVTGILGFGSICWFLSHPRGSLRNIVTSFAVGAVMTGLLILIFEYLLKVPLPAGVIFD